MHTETLNHTASSSSRSPATAAAARPLALGTGCLMSADCPGETLWMPLPLCLPDGASSYVWLPPLGSLLLSQILPRCTYWAGPSPGWQNSAPRTPVVEGEGGKRGYWATQPVGPHLLPPGDNPEFVIALYTLQSSQCTLSCKCLETETSLDSLSRPFQTQGRM